MSSIRSGAVAFGVAVYVVLATVILATAQKFAALGSDYSTQTRVLLALPVSEGVVLVTMLAIRHRRRVGATGLGATFALAIWVFNGIDLSVIVFSSAAAP